MQDYNFWPFAPWSPTVTNSPSLITWRLIETRMCWGVIFLLGGGFALADASQKSGLSTLLVAELNRLDLNSLPVSFNIYIQSDGVLSLVYPAVVANLLPGVSGDGQRDQHRLQHRHGQCVGSHPGRDVAHHVHPPGLPHPPRRHRLLLRLRSPGCNRAQRHRVRPQLHEDRRHDEGWVSRKN